MFSKYIDGFKEKLSQVIETVQIKCISEYERIAGESFPEGIYQSIEDIKAAQLSEEQAKFPHVTASFMLDEEVENPLLTASLVTSPYTLFKGEVMSVYSQNEHELTGYSIQMSDDLQSAVVEYHENIQEFKELNQEATKISEDVMIQSVNHLNHSLDNVEMVGEAGKQMDLAKERREPFFNINLMNLFSDKATIEGNFNLEPTLR